jgi:hypothetical protein
MQRVADLFNSSDFQAKIGLTIDVNTNCSRRTKWVMDLH